MVEFQQAAGSHAGPLTTHSEDRCMRRSTRLVTLLVCALSVVAASVASAQDEGFTVTTTDVGPVIGVGGLSGSGVGVGGRFEKGFKQLPNLKNGVLGIGVSLDYYSFGNSIG